MATEPSAFRQLKFFIEDIVPLDRDLLHMLVGALIFAVYVIWKTARRRPYRGREGFTIVLFVAILGEVLDIWDDVTGPGQPNIAESLKDIILTVSAPAALILGQWIYRWTGGFKPNGRP